jgi:hypothetical protein
MRTAVVILGYFAALGLGLFQMQRVSFESDFTRMRSDFCDGMLNNYILEHTWQVISNPDYRGSLSSPPSFFPQPTTLWYSEHLFGAAPVYWVLRLALPPDLAFQWWQIVFDVANFVVFALVLRWLGQPHILAILGGYLWAFALVHIDQAGHQQLIPRLWMPLAAYHAWMFVLALGSGGSQTRSSAPETTPGFPAATNASKHLNRMLACVLLQSVICMNTGWFLVTSLAVFLPLAVSLRPDGWVGLRSWLNEDRFRVLGIVSLWGLVLLAAFVPYIVVNWGITRDYRESLGLIPTPSAWFTAQPGTCWDQTLAPCRSRVAEECRLFCGFGIYALMLASAVCLLVTRRPNRPPTAALIGAGLLTAVIWGLLTIAAYNEGPTPWYYVRSLPGGAAVRCVSRVYVTIYLFGTLSALVWLGTITAHLRPLTRAMVLGTIAAFIIFEQTGAQLPSYDKKDFYSVVDRAAERLRGAEAGYVIQRLNDSQGNPHPRASEVMGMWVGLRANVPVVNGYSGRYPSADHPCSKPADDARLRKWLSGKFQGKVMIVDPANPEDARVIVIE